MFSITRRLALALVLVATACDAEDTPTPAVQPAPARAAAPKGELTAADRDRLRAGVARLTRGMTRTQALEALGVRLDGVPQLATGPQTEATTIYIPGGPEDLYLTWDASDPDHVILLRGLLVERGTAPPPLTP